MAIPKPTDRNHMSRGVVPPDTHSKPKTSSQAAYIV